MFSELFKVRVVVPRIFMAYSPDQKDLSKLVPYTICSMLQGERPKISSGKRLVDWIYVDDVVEGLVRVGAASNLDKVTFDLGSGSLASVRSVVETIGDIVGNGTVPEFGALSDRAMEPERIADVSFMERRLSWKPSTLLRAGLEKTVEWYKMAKNIAAYACLCWGMWDPIFDLVNTLQSLSLAQG
jgi:nucleoside-diphosphate-sugar epimerase